MSSGEDRPEAVAPEYVMAEKASRKRGGKKRRRPSERGGGGDEEEGKKADEMPQQQRVVVDDADETAAGNDCGADDGEGEAAEGGKKRKRRRVRKKKKGAGAAQEGEREDGGDTTTTGAAGDDEASDDDDPTLPSPTSAADAPPPPAVADKTVYVEGLSYGASEEDVTRFFQDKGCGKVLAVRMPRYQDTGRPRGYAHVDFKKADGVDRALALNGVTMMGRYLTVQRAHEPKLGGPQPPAVVQAKPPGCRTVFVKNLPYDVTEEVVREAFRFCGKIATVRLAAWRHTQHQKGFCYVEFEKEASAEVAVKKQGEIRVGGRRVFVDWETGRPKGSYRAPDGRLWSKAQHAKQQRK